MACAKVWRLYEISIQLANTFCRQLEVFLFLLMDFQQLFFVEHVYTSDILGLSCMHSMFNIYPQIFNDVQVRGMRGPFQNLQPVFLEVVHGGF